MRYITITRGQTKYKRRVMTAKEKRAWKANLSAAIKAAKGKRSNGHADASSKTQPAPAKTNGAMREHAAAPDDTAIRAARIAAALVHLKHGADWLDESGPSVADFDTAHLALIEARKALLGR